jgi:hypothetical protein
MGLALQARFGQAQRSIDAVLFGNVLGVFTSDIVAVSIVGLGSVLVVVLLYRRLLFSIFDPDVAGVSGVNVGLMEAVLMAMLSATILVTVRVVGVLLISAMLVLPAATARLLTDSFGRMLVLSPVLGAAIGVVGMYASWYADVPSGAVIILVGTALERQLPTIRSRSQIIRFSPLDTEIVRRVLAAEAIDGSGPSPAAIAAAAGRSGGSIDRARLLLDPESEIRQVMDRKRVFVFKEELATEPQFYYFYAT